MPVEKKGKRKLQIVLTEEEYQKLRRRAYELDMTVNRVVVFLALRK